MATANGLLIIERILRDREGIWEQIGQERDLGKLTRDMLVSSSVSLALYGAVLGASNDNALGQAVVSAIKLPLLFLVTLAICLPTLYLFNLVFGARLQVRQALALVLVAITVIATLAMAFAPISLFFLITANQYAFYKLLNVAILTLAALVGLRFLTAGMASLNRHNAQRAESVQRAAAAAANGAAANGSGATGAPVNGAAANGTAPAEAAPPTVDTTKVDSTDADTTKDGGNEAPKEVAVPATAGTSVVTAPVAPAQMAPVQMAPGQMAPVQMAPAQMAPAQMAPTQMAPVGMGMAEAQPWAPRDHRQMGPAGYPVSVQHGPPAVAERQASMTLLYVWILLFGFVGTQLAWTLRPFFGSPGEKFEIFRSLDGNFYVDIVRTLGQLF